MVRSEPSGDYLVVKHKFRASICRGVLAEQRPRVSINVVPVEVTLQRLAVSDRGVQVAAQRVDLPPLRVYAHLMAGTCTGTILTHKHTTMSLLTLTFHHLHQKHNYICITE